MGWWWRLARARRSTWAAAALLSSPNSHSHPAGLWSSPLVGQCCWMRPASCASSSLGESCDAPAAKPSALSTSTSSAPRHALSRPRPPPAPTACSSAGRMGCARRASRSARQARKVGQALSPANQFFLTSYLLLEGEAGAGFLSDLLPDLISDLLSE